MRSVEIIVTDRVAETKLFIEGTNHGYEWKISYSPNKTFRIFINIALEAYMLGTHFLVIEKLIQNYSRDTNGKWIEKEWIKH